MEHIFLNIIPVVNYIVIVWLISTFFLERRKCIPYKVLKIAFLVCGLIVLSGKYEVWIFGLAQILISCIFVDFLLGIYVLIQFLHILLLSKLSS